MSYRIFILLLVTMLGVSPLPGQEESASESKDPISEKVFKVPFDAPGVDGPDVAVLKNGTRINGDLLAFRGKSLEFKDSQLGVVKIRLHNLHSLFVASQRSVYFQNTKNDVPIKADLLPGLYTEATGFSLLRFDLNDLEASSSEEKPKAEKTNGEESKTEEPKAIEDPPVQPEPVSSRYRYLPLADVHEFRSSKWDLKPPEWKTNGSLSFSFQAFDGTTRRLQYGIDFRFTVKNPDHEFTSRFDGTYAEDQGTRSIQRGRGEFQYRYKTGPKNAIFFRETVEHDDFRNLRARSVTVAGGTFYFYQRPEFTWNLDLGLSFTYDENKRGVENKEFGGGNANMRLTWKPEDNVTFTLNDRFNQSFKRIDTFDNTLEATLSVNVWKKLTTSFSFWWRYRSIPPRNQKREDLRATIRFGWSF